MQVMNPLTPTRRERLQNILMSAFDAKGLLQFATVRLAFDDVRFADAVNFSQATANVVFDLVGVAVQHGYVSQLVLALRDERPNLPETAALVAELGLSPGPGESPSANEIPSAVRDAVVRFNERFQQRRRQFGYLNAYKRLHDLLHDLHDFQAQIEAVAAAVRRPSDDPPDPMSVTDPLTDWVQRGRESAQRTEFPNSPPKWIARYERAVGDLTAELNKADPATIDGPKLDRAVEILAHLPADEQKELNARLVECAMRLDTDELVDQMDFILTELSKASAAGSETDDLRAAVGPFRALCRGLSVLIDDHNDCQEIDGALREAVGLPEVIPDRLSQWADIKAWLQEIAARHPGDLRAARTNESTVQFEQVATSGDKKRTAQVFTRLQERFDDLFFNTDKALLEETRDLLAAAEVLDATLGRFRR